MPYPTDIIALNGSNKLFGGFIYSANFHQGFNGEPSTLDVDIVNDSQKYQEPILNYKTPYNIKLGNDVQLSMYAVKSCIDDGENGKILRVSFQDGTFRFKRYWIGLKGLYNGLDIPNVIQLGKTFDDLIKLKLPSSQFDHYSYDEFQAATAFLGIPQIPTNQYMTTNLQGSVTSVFNFFMEAYGYAWYLDFEGNVRLIDIKKPTILNSGIISQFETHSKRLSSSNCSDITNTVARGAVALENSGTQVNVLNGAISFWNGYFLGVPFKVFGDMNSCSAATLGRELYFVYMVMSWGWFDALKSIGYRVQELVPITDSRCSTLKNILINDKNSIYYKTGDGLPDENLWVLIYKDLPQKELTEYEIASKIGTLLKRKMYYITNSFINFDVQWQNGSSQMLDKNASISESVEFSDALDFEIGNYRNDKLSNLTSSDVYLMTFNDRVVPINAPGQYLVVNPTSRAVEPLSYSSSNNDIIEVPDSRRAFGRGIIESSSSLLSNTTLFNDGIPAQGQALDAINKALQDFQSLALTALPMEVPILAKDIDPKYVTPDYKVAVINNVFKGLSKNYKVALPIPNYAYYTKSVYGIGSPKAEFANTIYNIETKRLIGKNIPTVGDNTAEFEIISFENLIEEWVNPTDYLNQAAFSRDNINQTYTCNLRGISLGFQVTPLDGLIGIQIDWGTDGYRSSYSFSTKVPKAKAVETYKQRFPTN